MNDTDDFSVFDEDMLEYCARDVEVNVALYKVFQKWATRIPDAVQVEHEFYTAIDSQSRCGWHIDLDKAWALLRTLQLEKQDLEDELLELFP